MLLFVVKGKGIVFQIFVWNKANRKVFKCNTKNRNTKRQNVVLTQGLLLSEVMLH